MRNALIACEATADSPRASAAVVTVFQQLVHVWQVADLDSAMLASDDARHGDAAATARAQQACHPFTVVRLC